VQVVRVTRASLALAHLHTPQGAVSSPHWLTDCLRPALMGLKIAGGLPSLIQRLPAAYTVRKNDIILCSIERMLQTQLSGP
jgi:hypothetical protein